MREISVKALIVGAIVDNVSSALLGVVLVAYVIATQGIAQLPQDQIQPAVLAAIHGSALLYGLQILLGSACSVLGGYVASRLAPQRQVLNGILASWLCVGVGVYSLGKGGGVGSPLVHVALIAFTPVCYWLGVRFSLRAKTQHAPQA